MTIGENIKKARGRLKQAELAERLGVDVSTISRWENDRHLPNGILMKQVANALCTTTDFLYGKTDNPSPVSENLRQRVIELADSSWSDNMPNQISAGFNGTHYEIYDGNTNQTIRIPNDPEGRKIFLEFMNRTLNFHQPIVSNTINGDNNTNNKLGVDNN